MEDPYIFIHNLSSLQKRPEKNQASMGFESVNPRLLLQHSTKKSGFNGIWIREPTITVAALYQLSSAQVVLVFAF